MKVIKITTPLLLATMTSVPMLAHATVEQIDGKQATCYIFNKDKLSQKSACSYSGAVGGGYDYSIFELDFDVQGYGRVGIVNNVTLRAGDDNYMSISEETITLNSKKASLRYRDSQSLTVISEQELRSYEDKMGTPNWLECYQNPSSGLEFSYVPEYGMR